MPIPVRTLLLLLTSLLLISCGGGDSGDGGASGTPVVPGVPTGVMAVSNDAQIVLAWSASAGAAGYHIKRATTAGGPYAQIAATAGSPYTDPGLTPGTRYYYVVTAVNTAGESANSIEASATLNPLAGLPVLPADDLTINHLGLNTWFLSDWDGSMAFVDAIKHARPWQDATDWHKPVGGIDALGWPMADASTVIFTGSPAEVNGTYKLVFKGQAEIGLMWVGGSVNNKNYDAATNTTSADVTFAATATGSSGLIFRNTRRTAASAINTGFTDMHLYRPGYARDGSAVFTTPFLNALRKTRVVRMMDWTATNNNLVVRWADRITPLHMSKTGLSYTGPGGGKWSDSNPGVALEHQIQLCNTLHSDCWINIPVVADDSFVRNMALALRYGTDGTDPYTSVQANPVYPPLDPGLHVYLEYANEIWNSAGGFYSYGVIDDIVGSLPAGHPLLTPAQDNRYYLIWRYPAYRLAIASDLFRSVYGDASMMNRIRPVLMTQQGNGQATLEQALNWLDAYARRQTPPRTVADYLYGAGGSGYYNVTNEPADPGSPAGLSGFLDAFFAPGNYPQSMKGMAVDAVWAANFGLKRIAYEGGPSLDNHADVYANAINMDARMEDMIVRTHDAWSAVGGDLLMYYTVRGPAKWEFTPDLTNLASPKLKGLDQLDTRARAAVTLAQALPGTIVPTDQMDYRIRGGYDYLTTCDGLPCLGGNDLGEWVALAGHAAKTFAGNLVINAQTSLPTTIKVWVNGVDQGQVSLPVSAKLTNSSSLGVAIPAGLVVIRLEVLSGGFNLRSISVN